MKNLSFFLAWRILFTKSAQTPTHHMTWLCFSGIFIGSFSLALITAIMYGFEQAIEEKMQGIHSDLIINAREIPLSFSSLNKKLLRKFPLIAACSPHVTKHVLVQITNQKNTLPLVAMLKGIKPTLEPLTSTIAQKIINPAHSLLLPQLLAHNSVIIGKQCAQQNNIAIGDSLELLFINTKTTHTNKVTFESHYVTVTGIFNTGIDEYDEHIIYCSLSTLKSMFSEAPLEQIAVKLLSKHDAQTLKKSLREYLGVSVYSWKDLYPSLVAAQTLETYVAFIIISLIIAVASINIISLLYLYITQKRTEIALLKAIGMPEKSIARIFFIMGTGISTVATVAGLLCAVFVSYLLKKFPFITLPDSYYVTHVPVAMEWWIIAAVLCTVIIFSLSATWYAVQQIKKINVSSVLRLEG
jgi:lipoprotein-releasing system permease protein